MKTFHIELLFVATVLAAAGCGEGPSLVESGEAQQKRVRLEEWNEPQCHDYSMLLATTSGSPNGFECPNKRHKMRVTVATKAGEEIGALVFCECQPAEKPPQ